VQALKLTPRPAAGAAPHAVTFAIAARLSVPIQQWLLVFDDGTEAGGSGPPPATVKHTYEKDGVYPATLIVFPFPPFTPTAARFYTSADVTVGTEPPAAVSMVPTPESGPVPLAVSFRIEHAFTGPIQSWQLVFGDGKTREGAATWCWPP
jgi:PKD repeat protein